MTPAQALELASQPAAPSPKASPQATSVSSGASSSSSVSALLQSKTASGQKPLEGSVTISVPDPFGNCISELIDTAQNNDADFAKYQKAMEHYDTLGSKVAARTGDCLNYTLMYKGISPSCEGGDVVLDEKEKLKSLASAKYLKQKLHDEIQLKVLSNVMQLAMALGNSDDTDGAQQLKQGEEDLSKLVGKEQAAHAITLLTTMRDHESQLNKPMEKPIWTVSQMESRVQSTVQTAAASDPIVKDIQDDVHHFNRHNQATMVAHRVVRVALSAVSLAPSMVGPASQGVLFGYLMVTGGTEQEKVLKELYLDKRLTSRAHLLSEEAHLALENYQLAAMTNNKLLMTCSEQLMTRMTNADSTSKLLNSQEATDTPRAQ